MDYLTMPIGMKDILLTCPEITVALGASIVLLIDCFIKKGDKFIVAALSFAIVVCAAIGSYCLVSKGYTGQTAFGGMFVLDGYAVFFKFVFYVAAALTVLMSRVHARDRCVEEGEYYALLLFSLSGMMVMASGRDLLTIYVGMELMSLPLYALAGFSKSDTRSTEGVMKYVILGALSSAVMLYGISFVYGITGTTDLVGVAAALKDPATSTPVLGIAVVMLICSFGFKVAGVPFHMWAPDAYEGAPTPITAFMSVASKAAAFAMLARVLTEGFMPAYAKWQAVVAVVAVASMIYGNLAALVQKNIKRMLAYSSIGHAGYALLGVVAGTREGISGVMFYMAVYAMMNLGAFAVVVRLSGRPGGGEEIESYRGLSKKNGALALVMLIFLFSLAGIPPTAGFAGKFYVFMALIHKGFVGLAVIGVLASAAAAYFYIRIVMLMYMKEPEAEFSIMPGYGVFAVLVAAAIGVVVIGVFPGLVMEMAEKASLGM